MKSFVFFYCVPVLSASRCPPPPEVHRVSILLKEVCILRQFKRMAR